MQEISELSMLSKKFQFFFCFYYFIKKKKKENHFQSKISSTFNVIWIA